MIDGKELKSIISAWQHITEYKDDADITVLKKNKAIERGDIHAQNCKWKARQM